MIARRLAPLLFFCALLFAGSEAFAQNQAAADALFRSAQAAAEAGDWRTACDRFEESLRLEPAPGTILNIARCREKLGQWATAWNRYSEAKQKLPSGDARAKLAEKKASEIEGKVPHVVLKAPASETVIVVKLGNVEVSAASFGVPLPVDPGGVEVVVTAEGHEPWSKKFEIATGETSEVQLEIGAEQSVGASPVPDADPSTPAAKVEETQGGSVYPYLLLGGGALGIGAGVVFAVMAGNENNTVQAHCRGVACDRVGFEAAGRGATLQTAEIVAFSAGAVLAGLGVYFLVSESRDSGKEMKVGVTGDGTSATLTFGGSL